MRASSEFNVGAISQAFRPPKTGIALTSWSLSAILDARDCQLRGHFLSPARLAEAMRTDDALSVAYENRLAPQRCLHVEVIPAKGARGAAIAKEADALFGQHGVGLNPNALADIHGSLVNHGVAFGQVLATPRDDGSRVDFELHYWPTEFVRWDSNEQCFKTRIDPQDSEGFEVPITHGDGRWVIFKKEEWQPFTHGVLLAAAIVWARHAYAIRDWAKGSVAHGSAKVLGELPEGIPLQGEDGSLTEEASAMVELVKAFASSDSPAGLKPAGSKVEFVSNGSNAWQIFSELVTNAEKAAARIYLGTDGVLGSQGGAPGVDIQALFGVAATIVEGDLKCLERGIFEGVIEPWCAVNFGDSSLAPRRKYLIPDADSQTARDEHAKRAQYFYAEIKLARENGFDVTQEFVKILAKKYEVEVPRLVLTAPTPAAEPAAEQKDPSVEGPAWEEQALVKEHQTRMFHALLGDVRDLKAIGKPLNRAQISELATEYGIPETLSRMVMP